MAYAQTLGGGWASVRNVKEALRWAVILLHLAELLYDDATIRKCRVFIGYGHLWNGNLVAAKRIFRREQKLALSVHDDVQYNRCYAALDHLENNPAFTHRGDVDLLGIWAEVFGGAPPQRKKDLPS